MKEDLVSFELAVLAKEKGFDIKCKSHYYISNENKLEYSFSSKNIDWNFRTDWKGKYSFYIGIQKYSAPEQSLLQKWFRKKHNIYVLPCINENGDGTYWINYQIWLEKERDYTYDDHYHKKYKSYEEALEEALKEACKIIKEQRL